jgi:hypothetical protein
MQKMSGLPQGQAIRMTFGSGRKCWLFSKQKQFHVKLFRSEYPVAAESRLAFIPDTDDISTQ